MRAALIHRCGAPPTHAERAAPVPTEDQLTVRVTAASITPLDLLCASGRSYFGVPATPYVPGVQGVGELADGTAVWFATTAGMRPGDGSMAEYALVGRADIVALPEGVDHPLIAALGLSAVAALMALTWRGGLQAGEQVLVLGGGGVVGQAAKRAMSLGAADVVRLDSLDVEELAGRMRTAADGPVDLVVDPLFGVPAAAALRALRPGGRLVNLGSSAGETAAFDSATLRSGTLSVLGYTNNDLTTDQRADAIGVIAEYVAAGRLTVDYEAVPLANITAAWDHQTSGQADRRLVLLP